MALQIQAHSFFSITSNAYTAHIFLVTHSRLTTVMKTAAADLCLYYIIIHCNMNKRSGTDR